MEQTNDVISLKFEGDPQEYRLEFDFNEVADAEPVAGCNLLAVMTRPQEMTAGQLRGLTYAALKKAHPVVTLKEAGWLITKHTAVVSDAVAAVYGFTLAGEEVDEAPSVETSLDAADTSVRATGDGGA
ncbi:MAG: hypothetical protein LAQ69_22440 [Acidobacteriia bacterium]|nr:hypothetical protein [Terriglobia bacterium]